MASIHRRPYFRLSLCVAQAGPTIDAMADDKTMERSRYRVIVIGGGHAGAEAAWAAANLLAEPHAVALVTLDPAKIGVM